MASRAEQKAAARAAREAKQRELKAAQARRTRLMWLGGILGAAIVALVVVIVASSSNGGGSSSTHVSNSAKAAAQATVDSTLTGIPQHGNVLGNPNAKVTITEYGDLVCPTCDDFALTSEPQIIQDLVRTGKAKLVFRGFETASGTANGSQYVNTQVAARSAGLQNKEWNYVLTLYQEQPHTINGTPAEQVSYVNTNYLQDRAAQIKGLNLAQWQAHLTDPTLINQVHADGQAGLAAGVTGTPAIFVTGPKGTVYYDQNNTQSAVPSEQQIAQLVSQQS
jgi:protein-disulfide isomerase